MLKGIQRQECQLRSVVYTAEADDTALLVGPVVEVARYYVRGS